ncbi:Uncharacterised protein [Enterobacter cloacae]|uniref:hypothetical protein n=1 Tax=Enterobacter asburiae TaxID=61645 RepID=UPI0007973034|nr:hypothetical protein [Enterobacter asburiae]CAE7807079.1 hypothetical protein AI2797V1_3410 [Enterobacter cloacae]UWA73534.1 hypothetical protein M5T12_16890 [Enterobacter asburiae]CAE7820693.1 hypothetical protein AI2802V1_3395 [Enterobacter cloacae]CAH3816304.1 hypothetical protein AI2797V1_3410 [Enterobacter cloacae]CAH4003676.1 hypothetical protein AI2802V1_3395 [Enterobacter cloacae]
MIEQAIKISLERLTGMAVYPLLLPDSEQSGITFQRISDPEIETGMVRTGLIAGRFQISIYKVDDYTGLVKLDKAIWSHWKGIVHGELEGYPVQYIQRGNILQDKTTLTSNQIQYRLIRDYVLYFYEE